MNADRFHALTRLIGSRASRRSAVGFAATGLLAVAAPEAAAVRCSRQADCPICYRCTRRGRCRKKRDGATCATIGTCQNGLCEVKRR
jgi:hypothetical protein